MARAAADRNLQPAGLDALIATTLAGLANEAAIVIGRDAVAGLTLRCLSHSPECWLLDGTAALTVMVWPERGTWTVWEESTVRPLANQARHYESCKYLALGCFVQGRISGLWTHDVVSPAAEAKIAGKRSLLASRINERAAMLREMHDELDARLGNLQELLARSMDALKHENEMLRDRLGVLETKFAMHWRPLEFDEEDMDDVPSRRFVSDPGPYVDSMDEEGSCAGGEEETTTTTTTTKRKKEVREDKEEKEEKTARTQSWMERFGAGDFDLAD